MEQPADGADLHFISQRSSSATAGQGTACWRRWLTLHQPAEQQRDGGPWNSLLTALTYTSSASRAAERRRAKEQPADGADLLFISQQSYRGPWNSLLTAITTSWHYLPETCCTDNELITTVDAVMIDYSLNRIQSNEFVTVLTLIY